MSPQGCKVILIKILQITYKRSPAGPHFRRCFLTKKDTFCRTRYTNEILILIILSHACFVWNNALLLFLSSILFTAILRASGGWFSVINNTFIVAASQFIWPQSPVVAQCPASQLSVRIQSYNILLISDFYQVNQPRPSSRSSGRWHDDDPHLVVLRADVEVAGVMLHLRGQYRRRVHTHVVLTEDDLSVQRRVFGWARAADAQEVRSLLEQAAEGHLGAEVRGQMLHLWWLRRPTRWGYIRTLLLSLL